jgi:hypothetical protein
MAQIPGAATLLIHRSTNQLIVRPQATRQHFEDLLSRPATNGLPIACARATSFAFMRVSELLPIV